LGVVAWATASTRAVDRNLQQPRPIQRFRCLITHAQPNLPSDFDTTRNKAPALLLPFASLSVLLALSFARAHPYRLSELLVIVDSRCA
jgi:hypothetical protein